MGAARPNGTFTGECPLRSKMPLAADVRGGRKIAGDLAVSGADALASHIVGGRLIEVGPSSRSRAFAVYVDCICAPRRG